MNSPTITVLGAGYVGLTSAVLFAHANYKVYLIEPDESRLASIKSGISFFYEAGVNELLQKALENNLLIPTNSYEESIPESDVVFSCVGTPDNPDGSTNLTYVYDAAKSFLTLSKYTAIYVQKSTVPVGTGRQIMKLFAKSQKSLSYLSNPEFLREGTAIADTLYFDRIVVGGDNKDALAIVTDIYKTLESRRDIIAAEAQITSIAKPGQYFQTDLNSAELIKVTANAFLAMKISFANSIAKLADQADANIKTVMKAVGSDERIGTAFLSAGRGYGGGCFPKDVSGLISSAESFGLDLEIIKAVQAVNSSMPSYILGKVEAAHGDMKNTTVAVLGLAFKAGTSDVRRSPGIAIANLIEEKKGLVHAYDPEANREATEMLHTAITVHSSLESVLKDAEIVIITTDWPQFKTDVSTVIGPKTRLLVDAVNIFDPTALKGLGVAYMGVGQNEPTTPLARRAGDDQ